MTNAGPPTMLSLLLLACSSESGAVAGSASVSGPAVLEEPAPPPSSSEAPEADAPEPAAPLRSIPGSRVRVAVEPNATPLLHVPGFREDDGIDIIFMESSLPLPKDADLRRFAVAYANGIPGAEVRNTQQARYKGIEAVGDKTAVAMMYDPAGNFGGVMIRYPRRPSREKLRSILDSVELHPEETLDPLAMLEIRFDDLAGWRVFPMVGISITLGEETKGLPKSVYWPATVTFTFQPVFPPDGKDMLWFHEVTIEKREAKVLRKGAVKIDSMEGLELEAEGTHEGHEQSIYAVALRGEEGSFIMSGSVDKSRGAQVLPTMKQIVRSFHRARRGP